MTSVQKKKASNWVQHVRDYAKKNGVSYKKAMSESKASYHTAKASRKVANPDKKLKVETKEREEVKKVKKVKFKKSKEMDELPVPKLVRSKSVRPRKNDVQLVTESLPVPTKRRTYTRRKTKNVVPLETIPEEVGELE